MRDTSIKDTCSQYSLRFHPWRGRSMEEVEGERYEEVEGERHGGSGRGEVWRK